MDSKNVNTGKKDAKGRIIYKGPRGGEFVRGAAGKKLPPAMGGSKERPAAKSPTRVNLPNDLLRKIYNASNTGTKSRMQLATKRKDVFPANSPLFAKVAKLIHDKRSVAARAQGRGGTDPDPVASFGENLDDAKCTMTFHIYKSKTGLVKEDIHITLVGTPVPGVAGTMVYPFDAQYGVMYNRSKAGNRINRVDTYYNTGSAKWEQHDKDVAYIVEYIKRSAAANKLPFP